MNELNLILLFSYNQDFRNYINITTANRKSVELHLKKSYRKGKKRFFLKLDSSVLHVFCDVVSN